MMKARWGRIVNISSVVGAMTMAGVYGAMPEAVWLAIALGCYLALVVLGPKPLYPPIYRALVSPLGGTFGADRIARFEPDTNPKDEFDTQMAVGTRELGVRAALGVVVDIVRLQEFVHDAALWNR